MKRSCGVFALCLALALGCLIPAVSAEEPSVSLTVLFTHDTHDHFYPDADGRGGYTRLAALLKREREEADCPTVTLDGGDFSMGSLFQTIYTTDAPELRALGVMGYDVTTFGNHEFDYRGGGLAQMLTAAKESGDVLPQIVQANYRVNFNGEDTEDKLSVSEALNAYPVERSYVILEKEDGVGLDGTSPMRIAVFGIMGEDSHACAPMSGMELQDPVEAAGRVVAQIKADGGADFVICLSHSGTVDGKGEDYDLARAVKGIDLIISGHTHTELAAPIQVNGTYIVSCGAYTDNLGRVTLSKNSGDTAAAIRDYQLIPVDERVPEDTVMAAFADERKGKVNESYLSQFGLTYDQVLTRCERDFTMEETGNLIGDAYIAAVKAAEGEDYVPVDFAVAPSGVIRDHLRAGEVTTSQAYDILSLGSGADGSPGYPLISVYLTGADLKNAFEVDATVSALMPAATLYGAGMWWEWNPHRMLLDKVTAGGRVLPDGTVEELEEDRLYRVVADLYSGQMLGAVADKSFGLLTVTPREENGEIVTDLESRILTDETGAERKAWYALAAYLADRERVAPGETRKLSVPSWSPAALLASPGAPTLAALAALLLLLLAAAVLLRAVRGRRDRNG